MYGQHIMRTSYNIGTHDGKSFLRYLGYQYDRTQTPPVRSKASQLDKLNVKPFKEIKPMVQTA